MRTYVRRVYASDSCKLKSEHKRKTGQSLLGRFRSWTNDLPWRYSMVHLPSKLSSSVFRERTVPRESQLSLFMRFRATASFVARCSYAPGMPLARVASMLEISLYESRSSILFSSAFTKSIACVGYIRHVHIELLNTFFTTSPSTPFPTSSSA